MMFPKKGRKKTAKKRVSKETSSSLKKKLDKIFSEYIRLRDSYGKTGTSRGCCVSCGKSLCYSEGDCGHFQSRKYLSTRFNEANCSLQCKKCNIFNQGEQFAFGKAIDRFYGQGTADSLHKLARIRSKVTPMWYRGQIEVYKKKVKEFKETYGIKPVRLNVVDTPKTLEEEIEERVDDELWNRIVGDE